MADPSEVERWLQDLQDPDAMVRQVATEALWRHWYTQKGAYGAQLLVRSQTLLEAGKVTEAEDLLSDVVRDQPDFAEAWNRRAVLYFLEKKYWKAISDCEQVIRLVPYHFGALHGLGLCHAALGNYLAAIQALRRALAVQPHATVNQRLILEYTTHLN